MINKQNPNKGMKSKVILAVLIAFGLSMATVYSRLFDFSKVSLGRGLPKCELSRSMERLDIVEWSLSGPKPNATTYGPSAGVVVALA